MARIETFTFRLNNEERMMIDSISKQLQRTQSDSVRLLIREAFQQIVPSKCDQPQDLGELDESNSRNR